MVSFIGALIGYVLTAFVLVMIARLVVDWVVALGKDPEWVGKVRQVTHSLTEPVIAPVRRILPPVRAGGLAIDLAFTIVLLAALILRTVAFSF
ncbi:YggT family protein [Pseudonocardia sp. TRM90224]|uniref:YggT family protein n=1 Tax=Pseudonocardia sp. TRM90224 TaxID=2812678 RepID=UPI002107085A|nr:YggT family protein [Pseudonocardia sp. TRM90224]